MNRNTHLEIGLVEDNSKVVATKRVAKCAPNNPESTWLQGFTKNPKDVTCVKCSAAIGVEELAAAPEKVVLERFEGRLIHGIRSRYTVLINGVDYGYVEMTTGRYGRWQPFNVGGFAIVERYGDRFRSKEQAAVRLLEDYRAGALVSAPDYKVKEEERRIAAMARLKAYDEGVAARIKEREAAIETIRAMLLINSLSDEQRAALNVAISTMEKKKE